MAKIEKYFRIGEVSELSGKSKSTIDYWTRLRLLPVYRKSRSGRQYPESVFDIIGRVEKLQSAGKSLDEIRHMLVKE